MSSLALTWNCEIGERYQVQYKDFLNDPLWRNLGSPIVPADTQACFNTSLQYRAAISESKSCNG